MEPRAYRALSRHVGVSFYSAEITKRSYSNKMDWDMNDDMMNENDNKIE